MQTPAPPQKEYIITEEDLNCLHDYMSAAIVGEDITELPRLWNQEMGVIRSNPAPSPQENDDGDYDYYRCTSDTCEDSGGCCHLKIPKDGQEPSSCTTPEAFTDNDEEPECTWEKYTPEPSEHDTANPSPSPQPTEEGTEYTQPFADWLQHHDTTIRNATLDELHKMILQEKCFDENPTLPCKRNYDCVGHAIEILRTQPQEPKP